MHSRTDFTDNVQFEEGQILLTPEQAKVVNYQGTRLVVKAFAGSGKTFTLVQYALNNPRFRILYLAYNRAIRDEAAEKFPANTDCRTSHQIAWSVIGKRYSHKLTGNIRLTDIAQALGTRNWTLAKDVQDTLTEFLCSAESRILYTHFKRANNGKPLTPKQERYRNAVCDGAGQIWSRMTNLEDDFPATHDTYLKLYQLSSPNLSRRYDVILFDEAQDANSVTASIVLSQQCRILLVGDSHQQIYRFRGASNALDNPRLSGAERLYLTHSFRFGPAVCLVANSLLQLKGETVPVVGRGSKDQVIMNIPSSLGHRAIIHRTVMCVLETAFCYSDSGKQVHWVGGIDGYQLNELLDIYWFSRGKQDQIRNRKLLTEFRDFQEYVDVAESTRDSEMNRAIKIIDNYDAIPDRIAELRRNTVTDELEADVSVTTAHKAKGLEWDHVQLCDDFPDVLDPELDHDSRNDEINLLYVASTRAMRVLAINSSIEMVVRYISHKRLVEQRQEDS